MSPLTETLVSGGGWVQQNKGPHSSYASATNGVAITEAVTLYNGVDLEEFGLYSLIRQLSALEYKLFLKIFTFNKTNFPHHSSSRKFHKMNFKN